MLYLGLSKFPVGLGLLVLACLICLITILIYVEEVHYIIKHFRKKQRKEKTLWILALFPVSWTGQSNAYAYTKCESYKVLFYWLIAL